MPWLGIEIPSEYLPFEIIRRFKVLWQDILLDFELRHPETRRRLAIELDLQLSEQDKQRFKNLIRRFQAARRIISFLDWPLLMEWNERKLQASTLIEMTKVMDKNYQVADHKKSLGRALDRRLEELRDQIRQNSLEETPSFWRVFKRRWRFSPIRDEALYLVGRLQSIQEA